MKILTFINTFIVSMGYVLGTIFMYGLGFYLVDTFIDGHIESAFYNLVSFPFGYLFIYYICPKAYKIKVASICAILVFPLVLYGKGTFLPYLSFIYPILQDFTTFIPYILGYSIIRMTGKKETAVYRNFRHMELMGDVLGYFFLISISAFIYGLLFNYI